MELTPQEQMEIDKLDKDLQHTPTVKGLKDGQEQIRKDIKDDKEFNKSKFAEGAEKFKELSNGLKEVRDEVSDMKSDITKSIADLTDQIAKKEMTDLTDEVKALRGDKKDQAKNVDKLLYGAIGTIISFFIYSLPDIIMFFVEKFNTN